MPNPKYIILTSREWHEKTAKNLGDEFLLMTEREEFTAEKLAEIQPKYIFIPHWSYIIPAEIYENFNCIIFHMTDLPYGRGGSPLQNLIARGHKSTKISAIKCEKQLDAGDVYLKEDLDLSGTAQDIFEHSAGIIEKMISKIVSGNITPQPQQGEVVEFKRRKPQESDISELDSVEKIYDYIRMLDADGYPKAYIELPKGIRLEFDKADYKDGNLSARVKFICEEN